MLAVVEVEAVMVSLPPSILYAKSHTHQAKYQVNAAADSTARTMARMDAEMNQYIRRWAHCWSVGLVSRNPLHYEQAGSRHYEWLKAPLLCHRHSLVLAISLSLGPLMH